MPAKRRAVTKNDSERDERSDYESRGTAMILRAIETAADAGRQVAQDVAAELVEHTKHDDDRFDRLTRLVESIATDTKSLLASRSFIQGAWKTVVAVALSVSTLTGLVMTGLQYLRGH